MDLSTSEGGVKCPEGKVPCNPRADPTHVYCVDPSIVASNQCPITEIKVIEASEVRECTDGCKVINFGDQKLAISKKTNNKPLTTMKITTSQPCLSPLAQPYDEKRHYFLGELKSSETGCDRIPSAGSDGLSLDARYNPVGLKGVTQYDMEKESGVLDLLESYPHYTYTVFPSSSIKQKVEYDMFARPAIDWSLQCELDGKSRRSTDKFKLNFESKGADRLSKAFAITALSIAASPITAGEAALVMIPLAVPLNLGFLMRPTIKYWEWKTSLARDLVNVEELSWFNTCVDEHSTMNANVLAS